jgi:hypothetical protein
VISGSPSVADDNVFVGSRVKGNPSNTGIGYGYVSRLTPWRVLLCDSNRIVETTGSEPSWVCTGTSSPQRAQSFIGEDLQRPFSRPAKATRLPTDNILVVDTGNHRVVEIDRAGRIVWPLDEDGYEYYTSTDNHDLKLSRPADAHRYYTYRTETTPGGETRRFPIVRTIIADTGNARIIEVETQFYDPDTLVQDGRQRHTVRVLTPTYVRVGTSERGYERVRYTSVEPLRDPGNDALIGYLCAASNLNQLLVVTAGGERLVNPYASVATAGGSPNSTWAYWAWLYDGDLTDGENVSNEPLQFQNIKNVDVTRVGGTIHVAVTCGRYLGRSGAGAHALADDGPGVFEFRIDVSDPTDATTWARIPSPSGANWPNWYFLGSDYRGRAMTTINTAVATYDKRWYPVCSRRVSDDTVLITNSLSQIESATADNTGERQAVLGSHIFEVETLDDGTLVIDDERSVPAPGEMWAEPFSQPPYAEISR